MTQDAGLIRLISKSITFFLFLACGIALLVSAAAAQAHDESPTTWYDPACWYRRPITVTNPSGVVLTDFQVRIDLRSTQFNFAHAAENGRDLRMVTADQTTLLPYWLERYDPVMQTATLWAKIPALPPQQSTVVYLYYGNPTATPASNGQATFLWFDDFSQSLTGPYDRGYLWLDGDIRGSSLRSLFWNPAAQYFAGAHRRTYFTWLDLSGDILIAYYDHTTGATSQPYRVAPAADYANRGADQAHANPTLVVDPEGYIHVFYGGHQTNILYRKSLYPEDIHLFSGARVAVITGTYPHPAATRDNRMLLVYRGAGYNLDYRRSDDGGISWTDIKTLIAADGNWIYPTSLVLGNEQPTQSIHVLACRRNGGPGGPFDAVLYMHSADGGQTWTKANGEPIPLPARVGTVDVIAERQGVNICGSQLQLDSSNRPRVTYVLDGTVRLAAWDGATWVHLDTQAPDGDIYFQMTDDRKLGLYITRAVPNGVGGGNIEYWQSNNGGQTWHLFGRLSQDAAPPLISFSPSPVFNAQDDLRVLWITGNLDVFGGRDVTLHSWPRQIELKTSDRIDAGRYTSMTGAWRVLGGRLQETNLIRIGHNLATTKSFTTNMAVEWQMQVEVMNPANTNGSHLAGVILKSTPNAYLRVYERQKPGVTQVAYTIALNEGGIETILYEEPLEQLDLAHHRVEFWGDEVAFYRNDAVKWSGIISPTLVHADSPLAFITYNHVAVSFDDVRVRRLIRPEVAVEIGNEEINPSVVQVHLPLIIR